MPKRIQRRRTKGYCLPANARCVTRPGMFGNPYGTAGMFRWHVKTGAWFDLLSANYVNRRGVIPDSWDVKDIRRELGGLDLACFCKLCPDHADGLPLGVTCDKCQPCHADTLLALVNPAPATTDGEGR